jgi:hypothetical protein
MTTKRTRSDSAAAALNAAKNAAAPDLQPPDFVQISVDARPYFDAIVRARARDEWVDLHLIVAAQLAECLADQQMEQDQLIVEGRVITNDKGTPIANPRMAVCEQLARKELALMRALQMGGRTPGGEGDARNKAGARKAEANARKARAQVEAEDDGLLAR